MFTAVTYVLISRNKAIAADKMPHMAVTTHWSMRSDITRTAEAISRLAARMSTVFMSVFFLLVHVAVTDYVIVIGAKFCTGMCQDDARVC